MQQMLHGETEPPEEGQDIVKAVGSRGSNIFEVRFFSWSKIVSGKKMPRQHDLRSQ
jgi:hypothetical protein